MNPRSTSVPTSSTRSLSPTRRPWLPRTSLPSTGGWKTRTQVPLSEAPVTTASKRLPRAVLKQQRRRGLAHLALDLVGGVLLLRAVEGELGELAGGVGRRRAGEHRLEQPLRHQVRVAAVGRRRVGVVAHGEAEVAGALAGPGPRPRTRRRPSA
jgi:hypothetical protein